MIEELERMTKLLDELPETEQQALTRAFLAICDAYFLGQQIALANGRREPDDSRKWKLISTENRK